MQSNVYPFPGAARRVRATPQYRSSQRDGRLAQITGYLHDWRERRRKRKELEAMDDSLLSDIGVRREDIPKIVTGRS